MESGVRSAVRTYIALEIVTDDPARFRHLLGAMNAGEFCGEPAGTVRIERVGRCFDRVTRVDAVRCRSDGADRDAPAADFGPLERAIANTLGRPLLEL